MKTYKHAISLRPLKDVQFSRGRILALIFPGTEMISNSFYWL